MKDFNDMNNNGKKSYESIEIPKELNELVAKTIAAQNKEASRMNYTQNTMNNTTKNKAKTITSPRFRQGMAAAAVVLLAGTAGLNASPAFAETMAKAPIIGPLAQVLTFHSFHGTVEDVELDVDIPIIQTTIDSELPAEINAQIQQITNNYVESAKAEFYEDKEAFFAAGGTEAEWADRTMDIMIDYDVKYYDDTTLSLELLTTKCWVAAEEEHHFYTINLAEDKALTLADVLGKDYVSICNESIRAQIEARLAADENASFFGFGEDDNTIEGFTTVTEDTAFYLNSDGDVVVSFPEYSIAPGYMGVQEFTIEK